MIEMRSMKNNIDGYRANCTKKKQTIFNSMQTIKNWQAVMKFQEYINSNELILSQELHHNAKMRKV